MRWHKEGRIFGTSGVHHWKGDLPLQTSVLAGWVGGIALHQQGCPFKCANCTLTPSTTKQKSKSVNLYKTRRKIYNKCLIQPAQNIA